MLFKVAPSPHSPLARPCPSPLRVATLVDAAEGAGANKEKKMSGIKIELNTKKQQMQGLKMRASLAGSVIAIGSFIAMNRYFDGVTVAKLPFEPLGFVSGLSHRGIPGTDFTDCGFIFMYMLCSTALKGNLSKFLQLTPQDDGAPGLGQVWKQAWEQQQERLKLDD